MIKNRISLFLVTFLIIGFFFLALPDKSLSGVPTIGCCVTGFPEGPFTCEDDVECSACDNSVTQICNIDEQCLTVNECKSKSQSQPIPTINEWGLIAMAGILGIVGFMILRRRKVNT